MKLKPCPFCGGEAEKAWNGLTSLENKRVFIVCKECESVGKPIAFDGTFAGMQGEESKAIEAWNRRNPHD